MKGVLVSTVITIIFVVLSIAALIFLLSISGNIKLSSCKISFVEKIDSIRYRACEMSDMDLEFIEKLDLSCIKEVTFVEQENPKLKYIIEKTENTYDLKCPSGFYGIVSFDFSLAGDPKKLIIKDKEYHFLVSQRNVKLVFCEGQAEKCNNLNENECKKQIGCSWSNSICIGTPKSCYDLKKEECEKQKGCELL